MGTSRSSEIEPLYPLDPQVPDPNIIIRAARIIQKGGLVCFPTRALYGLGADAGNRDAVNRIFKIKRRPASNPLLVLIPNQAAVLELAAEVPDAAEHLMQVFWPGKITIVFKAQKSLLPELTAGTGKIGIRLPGHPVAAALVSEVGRPITGTSANISGGPGCARIEDLDQKVAQGIDLILDAGPLAGGTGSTVVDVTGERPRVIREGAVAAAQIEAVLR